MQNPRLRDGPDDWEAQEVEEQTANPPWPSDTPSPQNLSLSWSSASERDTSYIRPQRAYLPFGKQIYPRPKRIARFYPWDSHLIVIFASPAARRAVVAAYAWWMRRELVDAFNDNDKPLKPGALPPVSVGELMSGEVPVDAEEREAIQWARKIGWRPEYRIRPYRGRRKKNDDDGGWYETEIDIRLKVRERKRELERGKLEGERKDAEDPDLDFEGPGSDDKR